MDSRQLARKRFRRWQRKPYCYHCGLKLENFEWSTFDHVKPKSDGGTNWNANLVLSCATCNHERQSIPFDIWKIIKRVRYTVTRNRRDV